MKEWARNEVKRACEKENPNWNGKTFDYGCSCYQSALKAYEVLCDDKHSGFSFYATVQILRRLCSGKPLTAIEDIPENWNEISNESGETVFQSKRESSLFKNVYEDGRTTYNDNDRVVCRFIGDSTVLFHNNLCTKVIDQMFPITLPYYPAINPYKVFCEENTGAQQVMAVLYVITPDFERVEINRFFDVTAGCKEITKEQYEHIKKEGGKL